MDYGIGIIGVLGPLGKGAGLALKGVAGVLKEAQALGRVGEALAGIEKNSLRIDSLSKTASFRVPDGLTVTNGIVTSISEVKNVAYLSYTNQLKDYVAIAQKNGIALDLYVRGVTHSLGETTLSRPLRDAIGSGLINLKFIQ